MRAPRLAHPAGELVEHHLPDVVPVAGVLGPGVAQAHHEAGSGVRRLVLRRRPGGARAHPCPLSPGRAALGGGVAALGALAALGGLSLGLRLRDGLVGLLALDAGLGLGLGELGLQGLLG